MPVFDPSSLIWAVAAVATGGVILRPWRVPEYVWAVGAAVLLTAFGLVPLPTALGAVAEGGDVYLFLIGMMVLAELARQEGLFDWLAMYAVQHARGSGQRLFDLVFLVGVLVTVFLSNDATAVVLTPYCRFTRENYCGAADWRRPRSEPVDYRPLATLLWLVAVRREGEHVGALDFLRLGHW